MRIEAGDELFLKCAGGGYGPPAAREMQAVQDDLDDGYISPESARTRYHRTIVSDETREEGRWHVDA